MYAPHILYKLTEPSNDFNEFGRLMPSTEGEWEKICCCRCDDNNTKEFVSENGHVFRSKYHIVCEPIAWKSVKNGDRIRVLDEDGDVRGEGVVVSKMVNNMLDYSEIWV